MVVYQPGEISIRELLERQHQKYGKRIMQDMAKGHVYYEKKELMGDSKRKARKDCNSAYKRAGKEFDKKFKNVKFS